jgi:hypothetical protein
MKTVTATIEIDGTPAEVWAVLADLASYPQWNPLFPEASGDLAAGQRITLKSRPSSGRPMTIRPKIVTVKPDVELRWIASLPGIIGGEHAFILTPASGGTRLQQSETFRGLLVPFASRTLAGVESDFRALNEAIKNRAENR